MADISRLLNAYETIEEDQTEKRFQLSKGLKSYYHVFITNSPYAEVRASVANTDDPLLPVDTFRAWFLGLFFVGLFSALNQVSLNQVFPSALTPWI